MINLNESLNLLKVFYIASQDTYTWGAVTTLNWVYNHDTMLEV